MLKWLKVIAIFGIFGFTIFSKDQFHNSYLRYAVGSSVVQVLHPQRDGSGGTGFAVEGKSGVNYIATNHHVCEMEDEIGRVRIKQDGQHPVFKKVIYKDNIHDLCLIEGDPRLSPLKLASAPSKGDLHYVVGHPGLRELTVSSGEFVGMYDVELVENVETREECSGRVVELNDFQRIMYGIDFACLKNFRSYHSTAVIYGGNSGSPVVNKYGNVIGVAFAGSSQYERLNFLVPVYQLERVLNQF